MRLQNCRSYDPEDTSFSSGACVAFSLTTICSRTLQPRTCSSASQQIVNRRISLSRLREFIADRLKLMCEPEHRARKCSLSLSPSLSLIASLSLLMQTRACRCAEIDAADVAASERRDRSWIVGGSISITSEILDRYLAKAHACVRDDKSRYREGRRSGRYAGRIREIESALKNPQIPGIRPGLSDGYIYRCDRSRMTEMETSRRCMSETLGNFLRVRLGTNARRSFSLA